MPKTLKQIGAEKAHPEALKQMIPKGGRWAAYQNTAMDSKALGHLRFIKFGEPACTFPTADSLPERHPDTADSVGWRYLLVGEVDLTTGTINSEIKHD